jgi:hypothetical protein
MDTIFVIIWTHTYVLITKFDNANENTPLLAKTRPIEMAQGFLQIKFFGNFLGAKNG